MTLIQLCDPIFHYICRVNRIARNGGQIDYRTLKADIKERLEAIEASAQSDSHLAAQYKKIETPLFFFIDSMIVESGINCSAEWNENRLAYEHDELAGDEAFFDFLDKSLADTSDEAAERLLFFFMCLGLGFCGFYIGQPDVIKQKTSEIIPRIRKWLESDTFSRITPETYEHLNTANLVEPPTFKLLGIAIMFASMALFVLAFVVFLFHSASSDLSQAIETIQQNETTAEESEI